MKSFIGFDPQLMLDSIDNGIVAINEEGYITYLNKTAERLFSLPAHEALTRTT